MSEGRVEVFGRYLVYEPLGVGGMARVDRAELVGIEGFRRPVALKRMLPHVAASDEMVRAFVREARLLGHLRHANLAQTYEFGKVDDIYFIAMELVTGPTLREILQRSARPAGPIPIPVPIALNIINQVCDALDHAHNRCDETGQPLGIIHRDVSPSNVIIDEAGVAKLIDFGVAKASAPGMQTMTGMIKGKFGYMAPEYLVGEIDARADLFAIGVIAHEMLTAKPLFSTGDDLETMRRLRRMTVPPPSQANPDVPRAIDDIVLKALARDPDRRWQGAAALRAALTTAAERLGLACTNREVIEWIGRALALRRAQSATPVPAAAGARELEPPDPSVQLEVEPGSVPGGATAALPSRTEIELPPFELPPIDDGDAPSPSESLSMIDATVLQTSSDAIPLPDAPVPQTSSDAIPLPDAPEQNTAPQPSPLAPPRPRSVKRPPRSLGLAQVNDPLAEISPPRPLTPPFPRLPLLLPLPAPPLQPLPYHPRRGTTGTETQLTDAAPARRRGAVLVAILVLLAAGIAAAGAYLVLARLA